ncbi:MAG: PDZ domain-containing protein [Planctomycetes bacterium]|nr:PDZ domain-containing protein [Planctomycetota bacterium]
MTRTKHLFLATLLAALAAASVRADTPTEKRPAKVVVPIEILKTGHITVKVKVNGKGPYTLIFDTGAPINLMNNKIGKEAGLLKGMRRPAFTLFGSMGDVKVKELEVGGQKIGNVEAIVMDHPTVKAISDAFGPIDGIVGFPFFARFKMTMDYQAKTLTLVPNGFEPPSALKAMEATIMALLAGDPGPTILSSPGQWGMAVSKKSEDDDPGVTVTKVLAGSPAAQAGLKEGDRLLTLDGRWTDSVADTFTAAGFVKPGTTVPVVVKRGDKEMTLKVKPLSGL